MILQKLKYFLFRYVLIILPFYVFIHVIRLYNSLRFRKSFYLFGRNSFFHRINQLKSLSASDLVLSLADKSRARTVLSGILGNDFCIPLLGVFENVEALLNSPLRYPCVVKLNRGSGMNVFVRSRDELLSYPVLSKLKYWISVDPFCFSRERHYSRMKPCFVVEQFMGSGLRDYKIFCFNGKPKFIQVDDGRFTEHKRAFYDLEWKLLDIGLLYPRISYDITSPVMLDKMIETAALISKPFEFLRVDFYVIDSHFYIGECTFYPEGGMALFDTKAQDDWVGLFFNDNVRH